MLKSNASLLRAKKVKNDEFYTLYQDVKDELDHYTEWLSEKIILCNCNDGLESNFYKYFDDNFDRLKLKKLICTSYGENAYKIERIGDTTTVTPLKGDGDFSSPECIEFLKEADVVVTNPPFSKARSFLALLEEYHKQYIFIGNIALAKYKQVFPLIMENKLRLGFRSVNKRFSFNEG